MMNQNAQLLLKQAILKRKTIKNTNAWRLIHGSGDGFYGLTVDIFNNVFLVEQHKRDFDANQLLLALKEQYGLDIPIFLKERWSPFAEGRSGKQVNGLPIPSDFEIVENDLKFLIKLKDEEHVGLFLDSRIAREKVGKISKGKRVLNLFSYTGGFGMFAAKGEAKSTTNVDNKKSAINIAKSNYQLNNLPFDTRTFLKSDAFKFLQNSKKGKGNFDLIILDPPPKFKRPGKNDFYAKKDFAGLLARCFQLTEIDGMILAGLNALTVSDEEFDMQIKDAAELGKKPIKSVYKFGPDCDFPYCPQRPVARFALLKL